MYNPEDLDPVYSFLPYVAHEEEIPNPENHREIIRQISYYRTYPPFPWKPGTGNHRNDDPVAFINICADLGLVHWEKTEEREARLSRERERKMLSYG